MKKETKLFLGASFLSLLLGGCATTLDPISSKISEQSQSETSTSETLTSEVSTSEDTSSSDTTSTSEAHVHTEATREENRVEPTCTSKGSYDLFTVC